MNRLASSILVAAAVTIAGAASAEDDPDHFAMGTVALREGRYEDAIDRLEAYADRSPSHPDASFNRGLAYIMRVRNGDEQPGDLGRAAAAFEETLAMRSGDAEARQALAMVQGEVAKRRARRGEDSLLARPTLDRVIIHLATERTWGIAAIIGSLLLALGIVLWRRSGTQHLAGIIIAPASAVAVLVLVPLYLGARDLRLHTRTGVVVVREAQVLDEEGKPAGGEPIPETARLELGVRGDPAGPGVRGDPAGPGVRGDPAGLGQARGRLVHVRYGAREGWLPVSTIRTLRTR